MKRFLTSILCLALLASLLTGVSFAASGMDNFKKTNSYQSGRFTDAVSGAWYESGLAAAYDFGLVNGVSDKAFGVGSNMTIAEAVTLAARLHSIYHTGEVDFAAAEPWYQTYEALETAQLAALEANRLVSVLSGSSTQWDAAIKMLEGCTAALGRASDALR